MPLWPAPTTIASHRLAANSRIGAGSPRIPNVSAVRREASGMANLHEIITTRHRRARQPSRFAVGEVRGVLSGMRYDVAEAGGRRRCRLIARRRPPALAARRLAGERQRLGKRSTARKCLENARGFIRGVWLGLLARGSRARCGRAAGICGPLLVVDIACPGGHFPRTDPPAPGGDGVVRTVRGVLAYPRGGGQADRERFVRSARSVRPLHR